MSLNGWLHRGGDGIRTRVDGFAGRCLTTRPPHRGPDPWRTGSQISTTRSITASGRRESNPRPSPWQGDALPAELRPHCRSIEALELSAPFFRAETLSQVHAPFRARPSGVLPPEGFAVGALPTSKNITHRNGSGQIDRGRYRICRSRTKCSRVFNVASAIGAAVARFVHTEEVTGSIPVSRTVRGEPGPGRGRVLSCSGRVPGRSFRPRLPETPRARPAELDPEYIRGRRPLSVSGPLPTLSP